MAPADRNNPKKSQVSDATYTIMDFMRQFPDDAACLDYLWRRHYATADGQHAQCPKCEEVRKFHRVASRPSYSCDSCGHHIHPTANTIMHKSSSSLHLWFHAIFLMASTRMGISAKQLERELGVTYKTAWRMFTKIRNELMIEDGDRPLSGTVEVDETYVGGKPHQSDRAQWDGLPTSTERRQAAQAWGRNNKTTVFGMVERGGSVVSSVVPNRPQTAIMGKISAHVEPSTVIYTDEARLYDRLPQAGYTHETVNHSARIYVSGDVHTNTIEGFWSLVKCGILGTYRHVSPQWLQGYLNEYAWRYNRREHGFPMFLSLLAQIQPGA